MTNISIKGVIIDIKDTEQITEKFKKRVLWLKETEGQYPQTFEIQFTGNKTVILDHYSIGQVVEVGINLKGREYTDKSGNKRVFNSIEGWKINESGFSKHEPIKQRSAGEMLDEYSGRKEPIEEKPEANKEEEGEGGSLPF